VESGFIAGWEAKRQWNVTREEAWERLQTGDADD
jgi:hypothetical protein